MTDITAISHTLSSIKNLHDIGKALLEIRDGRITQEQVIEFNRVILATQQSALAANAAQSSLIEEKRNLERKIADMETWNTEKEKYQLIELPSGVLAHAHKEGVQTSEPKHYICTHCYNNGRKSVLQKQYKSVMSGESYACHGCKAEIKNHNAKQNESLKVNYRQQKNHPF